VATRRMIYSAIWEDEWFGQLDFFQQALWIGMFSKCADDQGRVYANYVLVRSAVFPYKDIPIADIKQAFKDFADAGKIILYEVGGKSYAQLVKWWEIQRPQWASPSIYPAPDGWRDRIRTRENGEYRVENWDGSVGAVQVDSSGGNIPEDDTYDVQVNSSGIVAPEHDTQPLQVGRHIPVPVPVPVPDPVPFPVPDPFPVPKENNTSSSINSSAAGERGAAVSMAIRAYTEAIGLINGSSQRDDMVAIINELIEKEVYGWWQSAVTIAADNNKLSWAYVKAILQNSLRDNRPPGGKRPEQRQAARTSGYVVGQRWG
jgi:hypothetical protein